MKYFLFFFFVCSTLHAQNIKILDGDTIHIAKVKYRFHGIDAPEISQICKKIIITLNAESYQSKS